MARGPSLDKLAHWTLFEPGLRLQSWAGADTVSVLGWAEPALSATDGRVCVCVCVCVTFIPHRCVNAFEYGTAQLFPTHRFSFHILEETGTTIGVITTWRL